MLGGLHGVRGTDPASPLPVGDHDVGDRGRDGLHGAARDRTARIRGPVRRSGGPRAARLPGHPVFRDARRWVRQRHRLPRSEAARTHSRHRPPVPRPWTCRRNGRDLPRRADPADPGRRRRAHPRGRGAAAERLVAERSERGAGDRRPRSVIGSDGAAPPIPPLLPGDPPRPILVAYDGTIALTDVSDTVMAEHVPGVWEDEVAAYDAGLMGSRRLMELEMSMIDVEPAALLATAAAQPHDPGFVPFVRRAQAAAIPVEIVSDGFGFFIEPAL